MSAECVGSVIVALNPQRPKPQTPKPVRLKLHMTNHAALKDLKFMGLPGTENGTRKKVLLYPEAPK